MKCDNLACSNKARYVDACGQLQCGVCDALTMRLSVRLSDLKALVQALPPTIFVPSGLSHGLSLNLIPDLFWVLSEQPALLDSLVEQGLITRKKRIVR